MIIDLKIGTIAMTPIILGIIVLLKNKFSVKEQYLWIVQGVLTMLAYALGEYLPDIYLGQAETIVKMLALFLVAAGTLTISGQAAQGYMASPSPALPLIANNIESSGLYTKLTTDVAWVQEVRSLRIPLLTVAATIALVTLMIVVVASLMGYSLGVWSIPVGMLATFLVTNGWWVVWMVAHKSERLDAKS